jgi:hypothetical protein
MKESMDVKILVMTETDVAEIIKREVGKYLSAISKPEPIQIPLKNGNYTSKELQELFNVTPPTINAWERKSLLKPIIIQRRKTYLREDIEKLIKQKQVNKRA